MEINKKNVNYLKLQKNIYKKYDIFIDIKACNNETKNIFIKHAYFDIS